MADVSVKALKNGPYEVSGGAKLFDHQDNEYPEDQLDLFLSAAAAFAEQTVL